MRLKDSSDVLIIDVAKVKCHAEKTERKKERKQNDSRFDFGQIFECPTAGPGRVNTICHTKC
jgi:hypothetical protein